MRVTKSQIYVLLTATTLVAAYFSVSVLRPPKQEFQDRAFPQGFRELLMNGVSSKVDPLFGFHQTPLKGTESKQGVQEVCDALFQDADSPAVGSRNSRIQMAVFLDYRCPYCRTLTNIISKLQSDNVRIVYKE
jgi:protein-disulfide isomerase